MGRKRLDKKIKKVPFNVSITNNVLEEFKRECHNRGERPSNVIEELIKKYYLNDIS